MKSFSPLDSLPCEDKVSDRSTSISPTMSMNRVVRLTSVALVSLICIIFSLFQIMQPASTMPKLLIEASPAISVAQNIDFGRHFQDLGVEGSNIYSIKKQGD